MGIGAAAVRKFIHEGWQVAFADIDDTSGRALAEETGALFVHADTRHAAEVQTAVDAAVDAFGGLTCVFCNAGIHRRNTMLDTPEEEFDLVVKTNLYGTYETDATIQGQVRLAKRLGMSLEETMACGDTPNDIDIMKTAGVAVAMGNAEKEVKEIADFITLTNRESGVAHALRKYILNS